MWNLYRLRKGWGFSKVLNQGKKTVNSEFVIFYLPNQLNNCRFGISIPRKIVKKATQRNYYKRQIKNILTCFLKEQKDDCQVYRSNHYDLVIIIRSGLSEKFTARQKSLVELLASISQKESNSVNLTKNKINTYA
ncbi:ribonuclease P protein component [endosymbiont GvMRE of Glomus versiforme]|uniref:ribonuclease P protein component n=1 Tax=endosymbiont GvMRE of Glomus versiforme TaxID=2039283 RepID=UPI000EC9DE60|nr:ribonuclease P protein component [endosymbiont GvMRE of Glomus versiforme]RHZ37739.1 Ribonuclease P protein component [endosymbiont GvMRE of Glomus versiforme]